MLCWLANDRNPQLEEIVLLTKAFSALLDECSSLIDLVCLTKDLKR